MLSGTLKRDRHRCRRVTRVLVGTSGWSYDDWEGTFYPRGADRLAFYAQRFPAVEVNYTHYQDPADMDVRTVASRLARARLASVVWKAPQALTHRAAPSRDPTLAAEAARAFVAALAPAARRGVCSGLLLQFAASTEPDAVDLAVDAVLAERPPAPVYAEVRHAVYADPGVLASLHARVSATGGAVVAIDHPGAVVTRPPEGTSAYFRFHGRTAFWEEDAPRPGGVHGAGKYDYLYTPQELDDLAERVREARAEHVHVFFNNHPGGKAAVNALAFLPKVGAERPAGPKAPSLEDFG